MKPILSFLCCHPGQVGDRLLERGPLLARGPRPRLQRGGALLLSESVESGFRERGNWAGWERFNRLAVSGGDPAAVGSHTRPRNLAWAIHRFHSRVRSLISWHKCYEAFTDKAVSLGFFIIG